MNEKTLAGRDGSRVEREVMQQLLARAARASGVEIVWDEQLADGVFRPPRHATGGRGIWWNPMLHTGDRYELARKLGMVLDFDSCQVSVYLSPDPQALPTIYGWAPGDECGEALAIVRAASVLAAA